MQIYLLSFDLFVFFIIKLDFKELMVKTEGYRLLNISAAFWVGHTHTKNMKGKYVDVWISIIILHMQGSLEPQRFEVNFNRNVRFNSLLSVQTCIYMQISLIQVPYSEKLALLIDCYITPVPSRQCLCTFFLLILATVFYQIMENKLPGIYQTVQLPPFTFIISCS